MRRLRLGVSALLGRESVEGGGRPRKPEAFRRGREACWFVFFAEGGVVVSLETDLALVAAMERVATAVESLDATVLIIHASIAHLARYAFEDLNEDRKIEAGPRHELRD